MQPEGRLAPMPPPPPPPPPLLPPPPPPPPPLHGAGFITNKGRRSSKMRNFNWETLPKHTVIGKHNIWTADKTDGKYELDTDHIEELFSHKQDQQKLQTLKRRSLRGLPVSHTGGEMVSILSSKRSMNIAIFLKQFKRPVSDMIQAIQAGNDLGFASGKLRELCKVLPEEEEEKLLVNFEGDPSALPEADLFMLKLVKIPCYQERLSSLVLKEEFFPLMAEMKEFISTLTAAGKELMESDSLHSVIRLVLKTGNYMNAGGYAGSAIGFRMTSLLKLVDTKANKPGMNLMHYVVMQSQNVDKALLNFPEQLKHIEDAARINKGEIEAEFSRQVKKLKDAEADSLKQEDLKVQMEGFLQEAEVCLAKIQLDLEELNSVNDSVAEYFCEDPSKFKLDECCSIFNSFCEKFKRGIQENKAREVTEVKRRHIDRLKFAAKRRSTATCSSRDQEMDGVALESILKNFLINSGSRRRPARPSSSHGSPTRGSPNCGSLEEITSQINLPTQKQIIGSSFKGKELGQKEWNSADKLSGYSKHKDVQSNGAECGKPLEEDTKISREDDLKGLALPVKVTTTISPSNRALSASSDDGKEDLQDNNEEEARKLREASKRVLRFQNSRGSSSSVDYSLENQKSPGASSLLRLQRTIDNDTDKYHDDTTNDDLASLFLNSECPAKRNLDRRHTVPNKSSKSEEKKDFPTENPVKTVDSSAREKGTPPAEGGGLDLSKQVFDFDNIPHYLPKAVAAQGHNPPSAESKSKPYFPKTHVMEASQNQEDESVETTGNHPRRNSESHPPKNAWSKNETPGLFLSFFKRLGDMSKLPNNKDTVDKGTGPGV